jgi:hypothetical protein
LGTKGDDFLYDVLVVMSNTKNQFINAKPLKDFDMILQQGYTSTTTFMNVTPKLRATKVAA